MEADADKNLNRSKSKAQNILTFVLKIALRGVPLRATYRGTLKEDYLSKYGSNLQLGCLGSLTNECASFQQTANRMRLFDFHR